jgi:hypothetical protein
MTVEVRMTKMSEIAVNECVAELRAACRRPIDESALDTIVGWLRPQFEKILDRIDGPRRWSDHGRRVRENSRHLGTLADFFSHHVDAEVVGINALTRAITLVRADCTTKAERVPLAWEYCNAAPVNVKPAEEFLRSIAPLPERVRRAG